MKKSIKKMISFILAIVIVIGLCDVRVYAKGNENLQTVYEGENFRVVFSIVSQWEGAYIGSVKIENIGSEIIHDWYLAYTFDNTIQNIWNAKIYDQNLNKYIIRHAD